MKKIYFSIPVLLLFLLEANTAFATDDLTDPADKLEHYYAENYQEMVFIHADKPYYLAGEVIRFKVYCLENSTSKPSQLSKVAYVELLDDTNVPQIQSKIELEHGTGFGEMYIPTNIKSGNLVLRGYTRWMRNYGPEVYFHALLPVINPFRRLGLPPLADFESNSIHFFPESGSIIDGVETKIVFEIKNGDGYPIDGRCQLYANDSILISEFKPLKNGLGSFNFKPDSQKQYHVKLITSDTTVSRHNIPVIKQKGISLMAKDSGDKFIVNLFCNDPALIKPQEPVRFLVHQKGKLIDEKLASLNLGRSSFQVEKSTLSDGVSTIAVLNNEGQLLQERLIFKYDGSEELSIINLNKKTFDTREKVALDMTELSHKMDPGKLDFSISIASHQDLFDQNALSLKNFVLIGNSLNFVYGLETYFDGTLEIVSQNLNNLLIAHHNKSKWQQLSNKKTDYIPEYRGPLITAKIVNKQTHDPVESIISYLSIPGKMNQFYASRSKSDGGLAFELKDFYGSKEIVLQTDYTKDSIYSIEVENPFSTEFLSMEIPVFNIDENMERWIEHQSENMQIENAYLKFSPKLPLLTQVDSSSFYHEPDSRYYLDDFTRFIVMEEVMREYISGVNVRKNRDGFHFMVIDIDKNLVYEENPLILLDGVPVFDADEIIALDPLKIKKIETIKRTFHKGILDCKGIVTYATYKGNLEGYNIHKDALVFEYEGIQPQKQYTFPAYPSTFDKRIKTPDFRNTLYWNPKMIIDQKDLEAIEFYTSDDANVYEIRIEGLDMDGHPFSEKSFIEVKKN